MQDNKEVVDFINNKLFESQFSERDYFSYLEFITTPIGDYIRYMGHCIWDSENEVRGWVNDDHYEDMEHFLLGEMNKIHYTIGCTIADLERCSDRW